MTIYGLGLDTINAVHVAILNGLSKEQSGIPMTPEVSAYWDQAVKEIAEMPDGAWLDIPDDGD